MSILAGTTGVLASFAAIIATGLLSPTNVSQFNIFPGLIVFILTLISLIVVVIRGFFASVGISTIFLAALAILSIFDRNSPVSNTLFYAPLTIILELLALYLGSFTAASTRTYSKSTLIYSAIVTFVGMISTFVFVSVADTQTYVNWIDLTLAVCIIFTAKLIGYNAFQLESRFLGIAHLAISLTAIGGTSFQKADLTEASFSFANLKHTDFRAAQLTRTYWYQARGLEFSRLEDTYLANPKIRQLVVTLNGKAQNFDGLNLEGVNLKGANLENASFIGTNLNYANLQNANLAKAILKQTQLDGTDFTGATLTRTFIEDWNITTNTKFDRVRCKCVYMRLPTKDDPDPHRKPDNRQEVFADGDFGDFIKPIFDTLDLYHNQGIDPRAIAIAFKELAENNPNAELEIVAIERRGEDKILLRAKTKVTADKSELSKEYFINYNQLKALAEKDFKALIAEKEYQINKLETMITTALERPSFYAQTYQNQGDTIMSEGSKKQSNFDLKGAQFAGGLVNADTVTAGQIGGNITNYSTEQKQNLAEAAAEIQQLLNQLSQTYPTATTSQKMSVVAKAVDKIESNPTLKARVIGALKAGGTEALKELIDNPLINILLASIEGWQEVE
ncbi:pentapeptide repeat-containing protein [Nostocales cyanobacterium LEGE 12452]|nr:pentapeptide repeat-containing protein [Nostocales cyanobacterium LEGE 12452]